MRLAMNFNPCCRRLKDVWHNWSKRDEPFFAAVFTGWDARESELHRFCKLFTTGVDGFLGGLAATIDAVVEVPRPADGGGRAGLFQELI